MLGKDLIDFIRRNRLEDVRILEGDGEELPGFVRAAEIARDLKMQPRQFLRLIEWDLIPEAVCIGDIWYVPCDLQLLSKSHLQKDVDLPAPQDDAADPQLASHKFIG